MQSTTGKSASIDAAEVAKFAGLARDWWDPEGSLKPLHLMQPCRLDYITGQIAAEFDRDLTGRAPLDGLRILDIGCGGGLLSEPMARLGAMVTGIDPAEQSVAAARHHAESGGVEVDYRATTAEALAASGTQFDLVLNMEVVEHLADVPGYLAACRDLVRPGGLLITSTLNRTKRSLALAVIGAEHVLRWLPRGTHDWRRFLTPDELSRHLRAAGLRTLDTSGFVFDPVRWDFRISQTDLAINYAVTARRAA